MKFLIVGRTGTGKDTLRKKLEDQLGWKFVKSYTTRCRRYPEEDTHIFISKNAASNYTDRIAQTSIRNGSGQKDEYFATREQFEQCDAYIVDPLGAYEVLCNVQDGQICIVYLDTYSKAFTAWNTVLRNRSLFKTVSRMLSERKQFKQFEQMIEDYYAYKSVRDNVFKNVFHVFHFYNTYDSECMDSFVRCIDRTFH